MEFNKYVLKNYIRFFENKIKELIDIHDISHDIEFEFDIYQHSSPSEKSIDYHFYVNIEIDKDHLDTDCLNTDRHGSKLYISYDKLIIDYQNKINLINRIYSFKKQIINYLIDEYALDIENEFNLLNHSMEDSYREDHRFSDFICIFNEKIDKKTGKQIFNDSTKNPRYIKEYSAFKIQSVFRNYQLKKAKSVIKAWKSFILFRPGSWLMKKAERSFESGRSIIKNE